MVLIWPKSKHFSIIALIFFTAKGIFQKDKKKKIIILEYVYWSLMIFQ